MLKALHYSQALRIGNRVETSDQAGCNDELRFSESLEDEIAQAFRNRRARDPRAFYFAGAPSNS
ncbi:hypothetical protein WME81_11430 [Sorangium sp. So ce1078]